METLYLAKHEGIKIRKRKGLTPDFSRIKPSAADRIRTGDLLTTNEVRYRLCHNSITLNELFHYTGSVPVLQA
jgi:hypothetical protein